MAAIFIRFRTTLLWLGVCFVLGRNMGLRSALDSGVLDASLLDATEGLLGKTLKKVIFVAVSRKTPCSAATGCPWDAAVGANRVDKMVANWKAELVAA